MRNQRVRTGKPTRNRRLRATRSRAATPGEGARIGREHSPLARSPELEAVLDKDRAFFRVQPKRTTRVRWTEQQENDALTHDGQSLPAMLPGYRWATVVHQVVPGGRLRRFCAWPEDQFPDPPESVCLDLFRFLNGQPETTIGRIEAEYRGRLH